MSFTMKRLKAPERRWKEKQTEGRKKLLTCPDNALKVNLEINTSTRGGAGKVCAKREQKNVNGLLIPRGWRRKPHNKTIEIIQKGERNESAFLQPTRTKERADPASDLQKPKPKPMLSELKFESNRVGNGGGGGGGRRVLDKSAIKQAKKERVKDSENEVSERVEEGESSYSLPNIRPNADFYRLTHPHPSSNLSSLLSESNEGGKEEKSEIDGREDESVHDNAGRNFSTPVLEEGEREGNWSFSTNEPWDVSEENARVEGELSSILQASEAGEREANLENVARSQSNKKDELSDEMMDFINDLNILLPRDYDHLFNLKSNDKRWKYLYYLANKLNNRADKEESSLPSPSPSVNKDGGGGAVGKKKERQNDSADSSENNNDSSLPRSTYKPVSPPTARAHSKSSRGE